jgi:hypothetical protein
MIFVCLIVAFIVLFFCVALRVFSSSHSYPQHTGPEVLKLYVTQKGFKNETKKMAEIKKRLGDITGKKKKKGFGLLF